MTRDEIEQKLWADQYHWGMIESEDRSIAGEVADAAVAAFRKRYPAEPTALKAAWYDEPPFPKNGKSHPCFVDNCAVHGDVYWLETEWRVWIVGSAYDQPLANRRVSPITKPQEPTT